MPKYNLEKRRFLHKLIFYFVIIASIIIFLGTYRNIYYMNKFANEDFVQKVEAHAKDKQRYFENFFVSLRSALLALANNELVLEDLHNENTLKNSRIIFKTFMQSNKEFMQLRYLNEKGQEILRIQRDEIADESYFVKASALQNKKDRYYFKDNQSLPKDIVWYSPIDLNMEHGAFELPYRPVVRLVTSIYLNNKFHGLLIVNVFMKDFLAYLTNSGFFDIYIINKEGEYLIHKNTEYNFSNILQRNRTLEDDFQEKAKSILTQAHPSKKIFVQDLKIRNNQELKMILVQKEEVLQQNKLASKQLGFIIGIAGIFLSIPLAYFFARPFNRVYEQLHQKTQELEELTKTLEDRVKEEVDENFHKEKIIMQQSKMASLGEMIGNIAHQWRQPLTRLSLILQNVDMAAQKNLLDTSRMKKYKEAADMQINFMSQTIDDFRNFFVPDKEKESFSIETCIHEALLLQDASLKHNNITPVVQVHSQSKLNGYKNEYAQVVLNLLNNAKDVFIERGVKKRLINITIKETATHSIVSVEDNAGGILDKNLDKIFEPYFTTKFKQEGTGIGLYMSKMIIEKHMNGIITAHNTEQGAKFMIQVPIEGNQ